MGDLDSDQPIVVTSDDTAKETDIDVRAAASTVDKAARLEQLRHLGPGILDRLHDEPPAREQALVSAATTAVPDEALLPRRGLFRRRR